MNPEPRPQDGAKQDGDRAAAQQTPSTDMQPEDAGTPESGNPARDTAAEKAMKQTSKTQAEQGGKG